MNIHEITEARSNPALNKKFDSGKSEIVNWIYNRPGKRIPNSNVGIHMGYSTKLGINPGMAVTEDSPRGIYFYPWGYWLNMVDNNSELPWADNAPYIHAFEYDSSKEYNVRSTFDPTKLLKILQGYGFDQSLINNAIKETSRSDAPLYNAIFNCLYMSGENQKPDNQNITLFNKIFQAMGYKSILDLGYGYIASNEPFQGIILDSSIIYKHNMVKNYSRQSKM